jgi:GGDEF domain-containing protein
VLRRLFRASDVIGRISEFEFAVLLTPGSAVDLHWLRRRLDVEVRRGALLPGLGLRIGVGTADPSGPRPVGDLLADGLRMARESIDRQTEAGDAAIL